MIFCSKYFLLYSKLKKCLLNTFLVGKVAYTFLPVVNWKGLLVIFKHWRMVTKQGSKPSVNYGCRLPVCTKAWSAVDFDLGQNVFWLFCVCPLAWLRGVTRPLFYWLCLISLFLCFSFYFYYGPCNTSGIQPSNQTFTSNFKPCMQHSIP